MHQDNTPSHVRYTLLRNPQYLRKCNKLSAKAIEK
jgi:hypothetical protein